MKTGIYKITNLVNSKFYIGSAVNIISRWSKHKSKLNLNKHHSPKLQNSWNKYGVDNFKFEIIEECDKEKLIEREQYYIDLYVSFNVGYNCTPKAGNTLGKICSVETRNKIRKALMGNKNFLGHFHSNETKNRLRESSKGNTNCLGRKISKETRDKIGKSNNGNKHCVGRIFSEQTLRKMSKSKSGKDKLNIIIQYDKNDNFVKEWNDIICLKTYGYRTKDISAVCSGKRKSAFGYKWKNKPLTN